MATIIREGVTLGYEDRGAGKPAFVFVHGWTCNRSFFKPQADHFEQRHRVVSVDLRGHGESDQPRGPYAVAAFMDDVAYVIEKLSLGKVAVGHSGGAITVLQLAVTYPERVAAVILVDAAPLVFPPELRAAIEAMLAAAEAGNQEPRRQLIAERMFLPTSDRRLVEFVLGVMLAAPVNVAVSTMRAFLAFEGPSAVAGCKVPVLNLVGTPPYNPPHVMSEWLPHVVNGWTVGAGHFNQLEVPDQVNAMIEGFLRHYVWPGK